MTVFIFSHARFACSALLQINVHFRLETRVYFDSCVFDLMTTGDKNFTLAAVASYKDILHFSPELSKTQKNWTSLDEYDKIHGNSATSFRTRYPEAFRMLTLTLILCIFFNLHVVITQENRCVGTSPP